MQTKIFIFDLFTKKRLPLMRGRRFLVSKCRREDNEKGTFGTSERKKRGDKTKKQSVFCPTAKKVP
jgi:hypothetical protein